MKSDQLGKKKSVKKNPEQPKNSNIEEVKIETPQPEDIDPKEFPVVGIGASAGGLAAFERLFSNLSPDAGMAYVVIQHLSSPHKSILPEIIQRYTSMAVVQVTDGIEVQPNHVYVIPPSNNLALMDGRLLLLKAPTDRSQRFPIDFFFRSLAEARKNRAIGIVLSGTASDGSLGVKTIKASGGLTIAQDPESAEFGDMPRNAIATHDIDFVLPPEKIGSFILKFINHQVFVPKIPDEIDDFGELGSLQKLYHLLRSKTGHDFSLYKQSTLLRRIDRRMKVTLVPDMDGYIQYMKENPEEIEALFHEMLINVTQFFREPDAFLTLAEKVLRPLILSRSSTQVPLRVWIAGCSSGEEAYSVAILIQELIEALNTDCKVQIYATDLDIEAVTAARRGIYADGSLENVSAERLKRFFIKEDDGFHVKKSIRDNIVFSNQNLIFDPPFSKIDLLCCRNVLIYLQPDLQQQLFPLFHYALVPGGFLFLGSSESVGGFSDLFSVVSRRFKLYQRKDVLNEHRIHTRIQPSVIPAVNTANEITLRRNNLGSLRDWTEKELLKYYMPASVIIDEKFNILFIHGRTGKYLEPASGEASANLIKMAREGLKSELATAIHTSSGDNRTITKKKIRVKTNGDYQFINLTVRPVDLGGRDSGLFMVVFEEIDPPHPDLGQPLPDHSASDRELAELEKALKEKDDYLTSIINELEDTNQELKSINEELLSSNEEMQSSNEELETSREELQSINEELSTVNAELQNKNTELTLLNNDVYNLLASTDIGTIFLDQDLQLRRFTPAIRKIYNLIPGDIGRPLRDFHSNLIYAHILEDIQQVLDTLAPKAVEAQTQDEVWYLVNIQPYRTLENVIDGVVITFVDITKQKQRDEQRRLETVLRDSNDAIIVQDLKGNIQAWNEAAVQMYGWSELETQTMNTIELIPEYLRDGMRDLYRRMVEGDNQRPFETRRITRNGRILDVWITPSLLFDHTNRPIGVLTTERDITNRKQTDQTYKFENRALKAVKEWFQSISRISDPTGRNNALCQMLVQNSGYRMAWIGHLEKSAKKAVVPAQWAGFRDGESAKANVVQPLVKQSQTLVETALEKKRPITIRNILVDPANNAWFSQALKHGFSSFIILPIPDGKNPGVLAIYADEPEAFIDQELANLRILAKELSGSEENSPEDSAKKE